jgi:ABC-type multidrug transport system fused ATPase/permease subunit
MNLFHKKYNWATQAQNFGLSYVNIWIIIFLSFLTTVAEIFGIGIFLPIFKFIQLEGDIDALVSDSDLWQYIVASFNYVNMEVSLPSLLIISFILFLSRQVFIYIRVVFSSAIKQKLIQIQRNRIFDAYIEADVEYHDNTSVGSITNVIISEVNDAVRFVMLPLELIVSLVMFLLYAAILFMLSWEMAILSIITFILTIVLIKTWILQSSRVGRNLVSANMSMSDFLVSRLQSPRLIRLSSTEILEKNKFHALTFLQRKYSVFSSILRAKTTVVMDPTIIAISLLFIYLSYSVFNLKIETIGLYLVIAMRLMPVVTTIVKRVQVIQSLLGSMEVLENRARILIEARERDYGDKLKKTVKKSILLNNISYRYPESKKDTLNDLTVEFKTGEITAIVGPSGSGKSTLIDLIPQLRIPTRGEVKIDGIDIKKYTLKSVRNLISYVGQSTQIFSGTIMNHICYGKKKLIGDEIQKVIDMAGVKEFVDRLPEGIDTIIGDNGIGLSGGQRQRLDLARALLKKSPVLLLDEPASNLDIESEKKLQQAIARINKETNIIIIVVTHKLESTSVFDQIIVLNEGSIEAIGTHSEVLKKSKWYSHAWKNKSYSSE